MFDDQETHYPVPGETPWERLRYLATNTETIYPVPPYVCMKCRRVIVPRKWALILHDLAEFLGYFWLFGIWFWPSVGVAPAKSIALPSIALFLLCMRGAAPLAYAAIPWALDIPDDPDAQFYAWATQKSVAYLRFFLRMLPVIAIFILP
ncbi:hypothetical protein [Faecousia sp.]|uniref:hypothetical protein n=1 Tax=Faecousia sp. TaxID=2952921 RepID=UPI0039F8DCCD